MIVENKIYQGWENAKREIDDMLSQGWILISLYSDGYFFHVSYKKAAKEEN